MLVRRRLSAPFWYLTVFISFCFFFLCLFAFINPSPAQAAPTYGWTYTIGGTSSDSGYSLAVDSSNNIFITGSFVSTNTDFDPTSGSDLKSSQGNADIFLTKIKSDGSYGWTYTIGGTSPNEVGYSVATDPSGNIFVVGTFYSTNVDFDPTSGTDLKSGNGDNDIFLTKINANGTYGWTYTFGGTDYDYGFFVTTDNNGNIYITGDFLGSNVDFDPTSGSDLKSSQGGYDIFVTKINSDATYGWTYTTGGTGSEIGRALATDSNSHLYITGTFGSSNVDFDPTSGTDTKSTQGGLDIFLTKINSDGTYGWTYTMGGTLAEDGYGLQIDASNNIFVTGYLQSTNVDFDPTSGSDLKSSQGGYDIFVTKINSDATYGWTYTTGGTEDDYGYSLATDAGNNIYLSGSFASANTDFDPTSGTDLKSSQGATDTFLTRINLDATYGWTYTIESNSSSDYNEALAISTDSLGNLYATGYFEDSVGSGLDFNPLSGSDIKNNAASDGSDDIFLLKWGVYTAPSSSPSPVTSIPHPPVCTDTAPSFAPNIQKINVTQNSATLFFSPAVFPVNKYFIAYGKSKNNLEYGVEYDQIYSSQSLSYTINLLSANTTYYFKVRGGNGCMPGSWSSILGAKTGGATPQEIIDNAQEGQRSVIKNIQTPALKPTSSPTPTVIVPKLGETQPIPKPVSFYQKIVNWISSLFSKIISH